MYQPISKFCVSRIIIISVLLSMFSMPDSAGMENSSSEQYLFVQGSVKDQIWVSTFVRFYPDAEPIGEQCPYGCPYTLELLDQEGVVILSREFGTDTMRVYMRNGEEIVSDSGMFNFTVPYSQRVRKLIVRKSADIWYEQVRSPHPPVVKIIKPEDADRVKGIIDLEWASDDVDATASSCQFDSSKDGGEIWFVHTPFVSDKTTQLDAKYFYAGNNDVILRVVCSDGLNAGMDSIKVFVTGSE